MTKKPKPRARVPKPMMAWATQKELDQYRNGDRVGFHVSAIKWADKDTEVVILPAGASDAAEVRRVRRALRGVRESIIENVGHNEWRIFILSQIDAALARKRRSQR